jgi:hypothetical protein
VSVVDARRWLQATQRYNRDNNRTLPLRQLVKVNDGIAHPLPGQAAQVVSADPVGTLYPVAQPFVPVDLRVLNGMSGVHSSALAQWANEDFGIDTDDIVNDRRSKIAVHYVSETWYQ